MEWLLNISDLKVSFSTYRGLVKALDGVSFGVKKGEALGVVGETGCGKSVTARAIIRLVSAPGKITGGSIMFDGRDLLTLDKDAMRTIRGKEISFVFQEAKKALDPTATIGSQLEEALWLSKGLSRNEARSVIPELLGKVGLSDAGRLMDSYSFELSGGMAQRIMIALAICGEPKLIIADEPTSALDVSVQAQILRLFEQLKNSFDSSLMMITHNLGVAAENCDRIVVMYAGRVAEMGPVDAIFRNPAHPYTASLLKALPSSDSTKLVAIPGLVPDLINPPPGCRFANRCSHAADACALSVPPMHQVGDEHFAACLFPMIKGEKHV